MTNASTLGEAPRGGTSRKRIGAMLPDERPSTSSAHTTTAAAVNMARLPLRVGWLYFAAVRPAATPAGCDQGCHRVAARWYPALRRHRWTRWSFGGRVVSPALTVGDA